MVTRDRLHRLIDDLAENDLQAAEELLGRLLKSPQDDSEDAVRRLLDSAPLDDEPTTPEEEAAVAEAWREYQRGETISAEEAKRTLLG